MSTTTETTKKKNGTKAKKNGARTRQVSALAGLSALDAVRLAKARNVTVDELVYGAAEKPTMTVPVEAVMRSMSLIQADEARLPTSDMVAETALNHAADEIDVLLAAMSTGISEIAVTDAIWRIGERARAAVAFAEGLRKSAAAKDGAS